MIHLADALFARDGRSREPIRHIAMSYGVIGSGASAKRNPLVWTSPDANSFRRRRARGDLTWYTVGGTASQPGLFQPECSYVHAGRIFVGGRLWDGNSSRAVLFRSDDGVIFARCVTGIEGPKASGSEARAIVGIAATATHLVALASSGQVAVSTDNGLSWVARANVGFSAGGTFGTAKCLAAGPDFFIAAGEKGQVFTSSDPLGAWTARNTGFGAYDINAAVVAQVAIICGYGGKIYTAPLANLATWTSRASGGTDYLEVAMTDGTRTFIGSVGWLTSVNGTTWSKPADTPMKGEVSRVRCLYRDGSKWCCHWGDGEFSKSDDGLAWQRVSSPGFPGEIIKAAGSLAG